VDAVSFIASKHLTVGVCLLVYLTTSNGSYLIINQLSYDHIILHSNDALIDLNIRSIVSYVIIIFIF
jgi:hypothetical protein